MTFQAFMDDSRKGGIFVLAGYLAPAEKWALFSQEWDERLKMSPRLDAFKMSEMRGSPERLERSSWFYRVVEDYVTASISCVIDVEGLLKAVKETVFPELMIGKEDLKNPFYAAFSPIINALLKAQEQIGINEPIDFIFDEQQREKGEVISAWDAMKLGCPPAFRKFMGTAPRFEDDKEYLPLQAADLFAWWVRYWEEQKIVDGLAKLKFPWEVRRKNLLQLTMRLGEVQFKEIFSQFHKKPRLALAALTNPNDILRKYAAQTSEWTAEDMLNEPYVARPYRARLRVTFSLKG